MSNSNQNDIKISIIVPVFNEKETILKIIDKIFSSFSTSQISFNIIIVDDGSTDGTREILALSEIFKSQFIKVVLHDSNQGKGSAIHSALKHCKGDFTIIQDADLEYNPNDILKMYKYAFSNNLLALYGTRNFGNNKHGAFMFYWGGLIVTYVCNVLFKQNLTDEATCYKLINTDLLKSFNLKEKGFAFCPEVTAYLSKKDIKIKEIPINYLPRSTEEGKKINWRDGLYAIWTLIKIKIKV